MGSHCARIRWRSDAHFRSGRYSRRHEWHFDGGAIIAGSSSPQVVPEPMSDSRAVDPEEALIASVSSCHMLWFLSLAQQAGHDVASYEDEAEGEMGRIGPGRMAIARIRLRPIVRFNGDRPDADALKRLHDEAHQNCFIANSLNTEIRVEPRET